MVDMYYFVSCLYIQLVPLCALDLSADELLIGWERTLAATAAKFGAWAVGTIGEPPFNWFHCARIKFNSRKCKHSLS